MSQHALGYSKSSRAKCRCAICKGSPMAAGSLRYGHTAQREFGETIEWRHWGCVTSATLTQLATINLGDIIGFKDLSSQDQQKVQLAISLRRVNAEDIPESAKKQGKSLAVNTGRNTGLTGSKRKAEERSSQHIPRLTDPTDHDLEDVAEEAIDEVYCTLVTSVVGIQYYKGLVGPGEEVVLVREPQNRYDVNAVQVKNISKTQVGHLPRNVVAKLSPLLDRRLVTVEGVMNDGNLSGPKGYSLSISLRIYGASDMRDHLEPQLTWATPGQRGFPSRSEQRPGLQASGSGRNARLPGAPVALSQPYSTQGQTPAQREALRKQQVALEKAIELKQMLSNLEKVDDESRRSSLLDELCSTDDILNLPLHPDPPSVRNGGLVVDLLKHQSQALQWCVDREYPILPKNEHDKPVQFWQMRKTGNKPYYHNIVTRTPQEDPPLLGRGALCADAMGLGKTLTMLALILATKNDVPPRFSKATLIVAPLSVLSNWEKQIEDHCTPGSLSTFVYYGTNRSMDAATIRNYDVVITTYQTVAGEYRDESDGVPAKKKKKTDQTLFDIQWKRIILDEGHTIRNPKTKVARALFSLNAERRWVLTGTPIINSPKDLGSILTFLQICKPLDNEDFYKRLLLRPLKNGEPSGAELLRALMSHICIRRTKEMQDAAGNSLIPLPSVEMIIVPVTLDDEARRLYNEVEQICKQRFESFVNRTNNSVMPSNALSMLTRMRQLALHPSLIPMDYVNELRASGNEDTPISLVTLNPDEKKRLKNLLAQAIEEYEECPICFSILNEPRITSCAHVFCFACITQAISRDPKCPMDRRALSANDLHEPPPPTDLSQAPIRREGSLDVTGIRGGSSAKIDQLVHLLKITPMSEKSLVFSQFTSFLDKIAEAFEKEGIPYVRFDGQMSAKRRQETIARFSVPLVGDMTEPRTEGNSEFENEFLDDDGGALSIRSEKGKGKAKNGEVRPTKNPRVMLLSLKAGAVGLNLTVANNVYLMDPWWQEGIESQAIDRVNRIGQTKNVHVYQLIAENTVESKVIEIQERKKILIKQAFSGIKRTETQRNKREARLQDIIELFGIRQRGGTLPDVRAN